MCGTSPDEYVSQRYFKEKSALCRIPIPYCMENIAPEEPKKVKTVNRVKEGLQLMRKQVQVEMEYEKIPVNEYLNYKLSEEITYGIKEVKAIAQEIKQIKIEKKNQFEQEHRKKDPHKIRIRKTNFRSVKPMIR